MKDTGTDGQELEIKVDASGNIEIEEKASEETWLFDEIITPPTSMHSIIFISNNTNYTLMRNGTGRREEREEPGMYYDDEFVFSWGGPGAGVWINQEYRTITLSEPATGDLLTFLQANATKQ